MPVSTKTTPDVVALPDIASRLQKAFARKAEEEARVPLAAVEVLQANLMAYSGAIQKQAEEKALAAMLQAVGETAPALTDLALVQSKLRTSLLALLEIVDGVPFVLEVVPEPAPSGIQAPSNETNAEEEAPDSSEDFDPEDIRALLTKIEALSHQQWKQYPAPRLMHMIQAYAAEIRHWQDNVRKSVV